MSTLGSSETIGGVNVQIGADLTGLRAGNNEARRIVSETRQQIESTPIQVRLDTRSARAELARLSDDIRREAISFGNPDLDARRRFAATRGGIAGGAGGGGGGGAGGGILGMAIRGGMALGAVRGAFGLYTGLQNIGSNDVKKQVAGIDAIGGIYLFGQAAMGISESIAGTTTSEILAGLNESERNFASFAEKNKLRYRDNEGALATAAYMGLSGLKGRNRLRADAIFERDEGIRNVKYQLEDKKISAEAAKAMREGLAVKLSSKLVDIEDAATIELSQTMGQIQLLEFRSAAYKPWGRTPGADRKIARQAIFSEKNIALQRARLTGGDVGAVTALYDAKLNSFDEDAAEEDRIAGSWRSSPAFSLQRRRNVEQSRRNRFLGQQSFDRSIEARIAVAGANQAGMEGLGAIIGAIGGMRGELASLDYSIAQGTGGQDAIRRRASLVGAQSAELRAMEASVLGMGRGGRGEMFDRFRDVGTGNGQETKKILEQIRDYLRSISEKGGLPN